MAHKILWNFEIQVDHLLTFKSSEFVFITKKEKALII